MNTQEIIIALELERESLQNKIDSLDTTILTLKQSLYLPTPSHLLSSMRVGPNPSENKNNNLEELDIYQQIEQVFKKEKRFLHKKEIMRSIKGEDSYNTDEPFKVKLTAVLIRLKSKNALVPKKIGTQNVNTFWGSPNWLDANGEILPEFMYDKDALLVGSTNNKPSIDI